MSDTPDVKSGKSISNVIAALSLIFNVVLGYFTYQQAQRASEATALVKQTELMMKAEGLKPKLTQSRIIMPGTALKGLTTLDHAKILVDNIPHPEFLENDIGRGLYQMIDSTKSVRALNGITAEFIMLRNDGSTPATEVRLVCDGSGQDVPVPDLQQNTTLFVPYLLTREQPWREQKSVCLYSEVKYVYVALGTVQREVMSIRPKTARTWIPSLNSIHGVGRALVSSENEHLFRQLQN